MRSQQRKQHTIIQQYKTKGQEYHGEKERERENNEECIFGVARTSSEEHNAYSATQVSVPLIFAHIVDLYTVLLQFASAWLEIKMRAMYKMHLRLQIHQARGAKPNRVESSNWWKQQANRLIWKKKHTNKSQKSSTVWKWLVETKTEIATMKPWQISSKHNVSCAQNDLYF